ncbi:MAG: hypothetical protein WB609_14410 [Candidatus Cybelea sp.]
MRYPTRNYAGTFSLKTPNLFISIKNGAIAILSSDNAGGGYSPNVGPGSNGPWRGDFPNTPFEGSHRVPAMIRWPGKVPAGIVTQETLAAGDWLPTLAGMTGTSNLVPKDRPIDGVDASAFILGESENTGRDPYMFFGIDGELMSVKWRIYKPAAGCWRRFLRSSRSSNAV